MTDELSQAQQGLFMFLEEHGLIESRYFKGNKQKFRITDMGEDVHLALHLMLKERKKNDRKRKARREYR
tara:strand:- start:1123 stop:1329 length:207 start_codon:yes stop_codon:yes gene_type:complete